MKRVADGVFVLRQDPVGSCRLGNLAFFGELGELDSGPMCSVGSCQYLEFLQMTLLCVLLVTKGDFSDP